MEITAGLVKELRELSGAGMMDCKKALSECNGNIEEAMEYLRKNGQAKAEKKASRIAAEGICRIATKSDTVAAVVEVNSETDFVAKNEEFQDFVMNVALVATETNVTNIDTFLTEAWPEDTSKTIKEVLIEKIARIGENLSIRRFEKVVAADGMVASYVHGGGKIGVIIEAKTDVINENIKEALTNLAMQVAAMSPLHVSTDEISEEYKAKEKEILLAQALLENSQLPEQKQKSQEIIEKMMIGRLAKQLKEICLLEQVYVRAEDGKQTVGQYVLATAKANGANLSIKRFVRFETGEGLEKKSEDFAAEVAKQMG
ncbi:MAG: translation elongation factor Ts [Lachnospiraceae bacterium]|nr:translation elongation factor Ts [Lachnospiraceae bacterium]